MPGELTLTYACPTLSQLYVVGDLVGTNSEQIRFRSRINSCSGAFSNTGCQIDITYSWTDTNFQSGSLSTTIAIGSSQTIVTPSGDPISTFSITGVSFNAGSCGGYNSSIQAC